jgi:hypothetical protein
MVKAMKQHKKGIILICVMFVLVVIVGSVIFLYRGSFDSSKYGSVRFDYVNVGSGQNVHTELNPREADLVLELFDKQKIHLPDKGLSCGFSDDISITFVPVNKGGETIKYLMGGDECGNFVNRDTKDIINISGTELQEMFNALQKYDAKFLWV